MNQPVGVCPETFKTIHSNVNKSKSIEQIRSFKAQLMSLAIKLEVDVSLGNQIAQLFSSLGSKAEWCTCKGAPKHIDW